MDQLNASIKTVESAMKMLNLRSDESIQASLRSIHAEKEASFTLLKKSNVELRNLSGVVQKKVSIMTPVHT